MAKDRVVVRGREAVRNVRITGKSLKGPESITPLGIAMCARMHEMHDFFTVTVNGRKVRLFNSKKLTVADCLILNGFSPEQLIGRTGKGISFQLGGVKRTVRGEYAKAAEIFVNGKPASLYTILEMGNEINVNPAKNG